MTHSRTREENIATFVRSQEVVSLLCNVRKKRLSCRCFFFTASDLVNNEDLVSIRVSSSQEYTLLFISLPSEFLWLFASKFTSAALPRESVMDSCANGAVGFGICKGFGDNCQIFGGGLHHHTPLSPHHADGERTQHVPSSACGRQRHAPRPTEIELRVVLSGCLAIGRAL